SAKVTGSKALADLATVMESSKVKPQPASIARTLLIELLAHQFAMPVLWIDTQDLIFREGTKRVIEMGPAPTLAGMAQKTYDSGVFGGKESPPEILWWGRDMATVTYAGMEDRGPSLDNFVSERQKAMLRAKEEQDEDEGVAHPPNVVVEQSNPKMSPAVVA